MDADIFTDANSMILRENQKELKIYHLAGRLFHLDLL